MFYFFIPIFVLSLSKAAIDPINDKMNVSAIEELDKCIAEFEIVDQISNSDKKVSNDPPKSETNAETAELHNDKVLDNYHLNHQQPHFHFKKNGAVNSHQAATATLPASMPPPPPPPLPTNWLSLNEKSFMRSKASQQSK